MDKDGYTQGETVSATVRVESLGPAFVERVRLDCGADAVPDGVSTTNHLANGTDWVGLGHGERTIDLGLSHDRTITVTGLVPARAAAIGTMGILCAASYDGLTGPHPRGETEALVTGVSNEVTGRFTVCENGPGAPGVRLDLVGAPMPSTAVTDPAGYFTFASVPAGIYQVDVQAPPGFRLNLPSETLVDVLVTGSGPRWSWSPLTMTPTDPAAPCAA